MADNEALKLRFRHGLDSNLLEANTDNNGTLFFARKGYLQTSFQSLEEYNKESKVKYVLNGNNEYIVNVEPFDPNTTYYVESFEGYLYGLFDGKYYSITSKFLDDAVFQKNVNIRGTLDVENNTTLEKNLEVKQDTYLNEDVTIGNKLTVNGNSELLDKVTIGNQIENSELVVYGPVSFIGQNTTIIGDSNKNRDENLDSPPDRKLLIYNNTQFGGGETNDDLQIDITAYTNDILIKNKSDINVHTPNINIYGYNKDTNGNLIPSEINIEGNVTQAGEFELNGSATIDGQLIVSLQTDLLSRVNIGTENAGADLYVYGSSYLFGPRTQIGLAYTDTNSDNVDDNENSLQIYSDNIQIGDDKQHVTTKEWLNRANFLAYTQGIEIDDSSNIDFTSPVMNMHIPKIEIDGGSATTLSQINIIGNTHMSGKVLLGDDEDLQAALTNNTLAERLYVLGDILFGDKDGSSDYNQIADTFDIYNKVQIGDYITNANYHDRTLKVYGPVTIGHEKRPQSLNLYGTTTLTGTTNLTGDVVIGLPISSGKSSATHSNTNTVYSLNIHNNTIIGSYTDNDNYEDRNLTVHGTTVIGHASRKKDLTVNGDVHITGSDLYLGSGTTATTRIQMTYSGTDSGDTLTITFND